MTEKLCPRCKQPMQKKGRVRIASGLKQRWICGRIKGCGHILEEKITEEK